MLTHPDKDFFDAFETFSLQVKNPNESVRSHLREHYQ